MTSTERIKGPFSVNEGMEEFLGVIEKIIKSDVDSDYGLLVGLLSKYESLVYRLNRLSKENDDLSEPGSEVNVELEEIDGKIKTKQTELLKVVDKLCKTPINSEERTPIVEDQLAIAKEMDELQEKRVRLASKQEKQTKTMEEKSVEMAEIQEELKSVVEQIQEALKSVERLKTDGNDRLDSIAVQNKHISKVDRIITKVYGNKLDKNEKKQMVSNVYLFMLLYSNAKKNTFKMAKEVATRAVAAYEDRKLLDSDDTSLQMVTAASHFDSDHVGFVGEKVFCPVSYNILGSRIFGALYGISSGFKVMSSLMESKLNGTLDKDSIQTAIETMAKSKDEVFSNHIDGGTNDAFSNYINMLDRIKGKDYSKSNMAM